MHPFLSSMNESFAKKLNFPFQKYDIINMDLTKNNINYIENAILSAKEGGILLLIFILKKDIRFNLLFLF